MARQKSVPAKAPAERSAKAKAEPTKRRTGAFEFIQQVREEASKVTWPTGKETWITTVMVFIMVLLAAVFFFVVDQILNLGVRFLLGIGG